jgi:hypothetical protein
VTRGAGLSALGEMGAATAEGHGRGWRSAFLAGNTGTAPELRA